MGKAASSNLVAPTFFTSFIICILTQSCSVSTQKPVQIYVENGLEIPFTEVFSHYNLQYRPKAVISKDGTSRKLISELYLKKNIIITRSLIAEEMELFKQFPISIDTLGFGSVSFSDSAGDINYGYNYSLSREKKIPFSLKIKNKTSYSFNQDSLEINTFRFPILLVSVSTENVVGKLTAYFDYELPNTILRKYKIEPFKHSHRTIFIE